MLLRSADRVYYTEPALQISAIARRKIPFARKNFGMGPRDDSHEAARACLLSGRSPLHSRVSISVESCHHDEKRLRRVNKFSHR